MSSTSGWRPATSCKSRIEGRLLLHCGRQCLGAIRTGCARSDRNRTRRAREERKAKDGARNECQFGVCFVRLAAPRSATMCFSVKTRRRGGWRHVIYGLSRSVLSTTRFRQVVFSSFNTTHLQLSLIRTQTCAHVLPAAWCVGANQSTSADTPPLAVGNA